MIYINGNYSLNDFPVKNSLESSDELFIISSGMPYRISPGSLGTGDWYSLLNKPFDTYDENYFTAVAVSDGTSVTNKLSFDSSSLEDIYLAYNNSSADKYIQKIVIDGMDNNPDMKSYFDGKYLSFENPNNDTSNYITTQVWNVLNSDTYKIYELNGIITHSLVYGANNGGYGYTANYVTHQSMNCPYFMIDIIGEWVSGKQYKQGYFAAYDGKLYKCLTANSDNTFDETKWQLIGSGNNGLDFEALSSALTGGIQTGINVTADNENQKFNFSVTGLPNITIDAEGYWTIDGIRGDNPTKAQGENGADGISPTSVIEQTKTGAKITVTDKNGETSADLTNGANGITPTINSTTKHWMIGETDTGIIAEGTTTVQTTAINYTGVLTADNWVGETAPYTQTVSITGITAEVSPIVDIVISDTVEAGLDEMKQWGYISKAVTNDGTITFSCYKAKPTIAINFKVKVV